MASIDRSYTTSYWSVVVTVAVYFTVFEIKRDVGRKNANFSYSPSFNLHDRLEPPLFFSKLLIQTVRIHKLLKSS